MNRRNLLTVSFLPLFVSTIFAGEAPKRVLLLAGKDSHSYGAHHHMAGIKVLAECLEGAPGLETSIHLADGKWPEGPELIRNADGVVLFMDMGMHWEQADPERQAALEDLMARGGGFIALHWAVGGRDAKLIPFHLRLLGGCHGGPDRKYTHAETTLLTTTVKECPNQAAAWAFERPDGGRSFGFVCLHAHANWGLSNVVVWRHKRCFGQ